MGKTFNRLMRAATGLRYRDTQCGFKLFGAAAAEDCFRTATLTGWGFDAEILFIATHLGLLPGERRYQIRKLLPLVDASPADVKIMLGDLNEWFLWGRLLRWLRRDFGRLPAPRTFPANRPWFALDRLWVKPTGAVQTLRAHRSEMARLASDHLPLVAEMTI